MSMPLSYAKGLVAFCASALMFMILAACGPETSVETDREALVALYHSTDGSNWLRNEQWLTSLPTGEWAGVTTDDDGRIIGLDLAANELDGQLPPELGNLDRLEILLLTESRTMTNLTTSLAGKSLGEAADRAIEDVARESANPRNQTVERNRLSGCIPSILETQLNMERSDLGGMPFCTGSEAEGLADHEPGEIVVPITEADEAYEACGGYYHGMHIGNTEVEIIRCIMQELEGRGSTPEAYEDLLAASLYSESLKRGPRF